MMKIRSVDELLYIIEICNILNVTIDGDKSKGPNDRMIVRDGGEVIDKMSSSKEATSNSEGLKMYQVKSHLDVFKVSPTYRFIISTLAVALSE